jgi:hypothetical protein
MVKRPHGGACIAIGHTQRAHGASAAQVPGRVFGRQPRGRNPQTHLVADPARHHLARAPGQIGRQIRQHLDRARLAPQSFYRKQAQSLGTSLQERGHHVTVRYAMRYGQPSIPAQLQALKAEGVQRVLIVPAYPQYSGTTTASVFDAVYHWGLKTRLIPEMRFVNHYHDDPRYIAALAQTVREHWAANGQSEQLVMSFHGVPERTLHWATPTTASA